MSENLDSSPETIDTRPENADYYLRLSEAVAEYYRKLEAEGKGIHRIIEGTTSEGTFVEVSEFSDVPVPPKFKPENQPDEDFREQWSAWHSGRQYSVFVYPANEIPSDFTDGPVPQRLGDVIEMMGSGINIDVENPSRPITATKADVERALKEGSKDKDPEGFKQLYEAWRQSVEGADKLHLPQMPHDAATFNSQPIEALA